MDPLAQFKEAQKQGWAHFVPLEVMTTPPAARLIRHARVRAGQRVLDVCVRNRSGRHHGATCRRLCRRPRLHATTARARARECTDRRRRYRVARGRRRSAALPRRLVRRCPQPVRPHVRTETRRSGGSDAPRAEAWWNDCVFDVAPRALRRPHVSAGGRLYAPATAGRCAAGPVGRSAGRPRAARIGRQRTWCSIAPRCGYRR